mgnify:CR=1 FL=1
MLNPSSYDDKYEGNKELATLFTNRLEDLKNEIKVQLPCRVVKVLNNNQVNIEILDYDNNNGQAIPYPILPNIPIRQPVYSGSAYMILPVRVGDVGTIEFFDSSVKELIATGKFDYDYTEEWHSLNNGLFTNGFLPKDKLITINTSDKIIMATHNKVFTFTVDANDNLVVSTPTMTINGNLIVNGNITQTGDFTSSGTITGTTDVVAGTIALKGHKHNDSLGSPTSAPLPS